MWERSEEEEESRKWKKTGGLWYWWPSPARAIAPCNKETRSHIINSQTIVNATYDINNKQVSCLLPDFRPVHDSSSCPSFLHFCDSLCQDNSVFLRFWPAEQIRLITKWAIYLFKYKFNFGTCFKKYLTMLGSVLKCIPLLEAL